MRFARAASSSMPLPSVEYPRTPMHTRTVRVDAYRRDDGHWDLEAELVDVKPHDVPLQSGVRKGGDPMHVMRLRVVIDGEFNIVDAIAASDAVPYPGYCEQIVGDYGKLVGLNLVRGFRAGLRDRLANRDGCTHLTELAQSLPTAAVQAFAGDEHRRVEMERDANGQEKRPFQLDRCHALRSDGPAVQLYYPAWFRAETRPARAGHAPDGSTLEMRAAAIRAPAARSAEASSTEARSTEARSTEARSTEARSTEARSTEASSANPRATDAPAIQDSAASREERP